MARKLKKQTRVTHKISAVAPERSAATSLPHPSRVNLPHALKATTDYSQFAYVSEDLKKIAVITSLILLSYAVIFVANNQLSLF